jgi:hypothetical protein
MTMDVLTFIIARELDKMGVSAGAFNSMSDLDQVHVFNSLRFSVKAQLRRHVDLLKILDKAIAERLFEGCDP